MGLKRRYIKSLLNSTEKFDSNISTISWLRSYPEADALPETVILNTFTKNFNN